MAARALNDLLVLDLSTRVSGAWCTRLLADFGAAVVLVEPPTGSPLRALGPFARDSQTGAEVSVPAAYLLANKQSVTIDADTRDGAALLQRFMARVDVVVEDGAIAAADGGYDGLLRRHPRLVLASITPHGRSGGREAWPGNDLTAFALSGWASINGLAQRPPLKGSGFNASMVAGIAGYAAILAALIARDRDGQGQAVDVAEADVLASAFSPQQLRAQYTGRADRRDERVDMTTGPVPVKDGYFALTISRAHFWRDAMNLFGLHDLAEDRRYDVSWYRRQHKDEYVQRVEARMAQWTKIDLFEALATLRVVAGPVLSMAELADNPHLRAREYFTRPQGNAAEFPGAPFRLSETPWSLDRPAPQPGEHNQLLADFIEERAGGAR